MFSVFDITYVNIHLVLYIVFQQKPNLDPDYPAGELTVLNAVYDDVVKVEFRFSSPQVNLDVSEINIVACKHPG